jgi:hypothetical protein
VQVVDEHQDGGLGVGAADADVVQLPAEAEGEFAVSVDPVGTDPVVGVAGAVAGCGFGAAGAGGGGCGALRQGPVRPLVVVDGGEVLEEGLELRECRGPGGLGSEPGFEGLPEPFDLALGLWVAGPAVFLLDTEAAQFGFEAVAAARPRIWW